jgi:hypothetical protein
VPDLKGNLEPGFSPQQGALCPSACTPIIANLMI